MSNWLLIPGTGGQATSPTITAAGTMTDADGTAWYLDCTRCTSIVLQMTSTATVGGTFQLVETYDGTNFANIGDPVNVVNGSILQLFTQAQFGRIKVDCANVTNLDSTHSLTVVIRGQAVGSGIN